MLEGAEINWNSADEGLIATHNVFEIIPESTGPRATTARGVVAYSRRTAAGSLSYYPDSHVTAIFLAPTRGMNLTLGSQEPRTLDVSAGMITVNPAGVLCRSNWSSPYETVIFSILPSTLQELAQSENPPLAQQLRAGVSARPDVHALHLAKLVKGELLRDGPANALYLDSLIALFGIHLLRNYNDIVTNTTTSGRLSLAAERRVRDFLEENFGRKLSIMELAGIAKLSKSHFTQAFTATFGQSPHQHVLNLRLDHAEHLLMNEDMSVAEIAYLSGFSSQSHLTSQMRKFRQRTPNQFRPLSRGTDR